MLRKSLLIVTLGVAVAAVTFSTRASASDPIGGAIVGGAIGAAAGGPPGAVVGAIIGSAIASEDNYRRHRYYGDRGYYAPAPQAYYAPAPQAYYQPAPRAYYQPAPAYYAPAPVYYGGYDSKYSRRYDDRRYDDRRYSREARHYRAEESRYYR